MIMDDKPKKKKTAARPGRAMLVRTVILLAVCGVVAFAVLACKLYEIQITDSGKYESAALDAQLRQTTISASRGTVFDTNGKILAMSAAVENVFISPYELYRDEQNIEFIATGLSTILDVTRDSIMEKTEKKTSQYQVIKQKVESGEAEQVRAFISDNKLKGIHLEAASKRYYPNGELASQIIGFVGTDNNGLYGLEQRYDEYLTGVNGRMVRLKNARGTDLLFNGYDDYYGAHNGNNITLTIDSTIQYFVEKHLKQAIVDYDIKNGGMCIAMNAKTGALLAIANYPDFDPNNFEKIGDNEMERLNLIDDEEEYNQELKSAQYLQWRNRALTDVYEPGSVFKILTLAMALEENVANPNSIFNCSGSIEIVGRVDKEEKPIPLRCWRRWGHGEQTLREAIQHSCNITCVELGLRLGARTYYKYVDAFGLRDKTGLDSIEGRGKWWDDSAFFDRKNQSQLASATFGQTFGVTPIQMITAATAAVNGGYLMQPYIVKQVTDGEGNIIEVTEPTVRRQVISNETSAVVRDILEDVVSIGTGKNAKVMGYRIGGKTGTSEDVVKIALSEKNARKDYIVSFLGFAPADDPEIVILLLLDTPSYSTGISISGGSMAAPAVGKMMADILPLCLGIMPQYTEDEIKDINVTVPRVTDRDVEAAKDLLWVSGLMYTVVGEGESVTGQLPAPNAYIASGSTVIIYAGEEAPEGTAIVPLLSGMAYSAAKKALEDRGLFIRTSGAPKSDKKVAVSVQSIPAEEEVAYGSVVEVTLIDKDVIELRN